MTIPVRSKSFDRNKKKVYYVLKYRIIFHIFDLVCRSLAFYLMKLPNNAIGLGRRGKKN